MRFKIDKNLQLVAAAMAEPKADEIVAVELCEHFIKAGMIEDDEEIWGEPVVRALSGTRFVVDIWNVLGQYLRTDPGLSTYYSFLNCVVMGDGTCPFCGGYLKQTGAEGHEIKDGDYYQPNSVIIDNYIYECPTCGERIESEKQL